MSLVGARSKVRILVCTTPGNSRHNRLINICVSIKWACLQHLLRRFSDINKHPISFCDLHRLIDSKFSNSTFIKHVSRISVVSSHFLSTLGI